MDRPDLARSLAPADNAHGASRTADLDLVVAQSSERTGPPNRRATTARRDPCGAGAHARRGLPNRRASRRHGARRRRPAAGRSLRVRQPDPVADVLEWRPVRDPRSGSTRARSCERWACDSTVREALTSVSPTMSGPDARSRHHDRHRRTEPANAISEALAAQMTAEPAAASDDERVGAVSSQPLVRCSAPGPICANALGRMPVLVAQIRATSVCTWPS